MSEDIAALLLTLAEIAELRGQLAAAQDISMETAIDAGRLHARIEFLRAEPSMDRRGEAGSLATGSTAVSVVAR